MESLNLYTAFYEVAKYKSFSIAAQKLYISQPAVSKSISRLEEELQTKLFFRSSKGVRLTTEGEILFHHVEQSMQSLAEGKNLVLSRLNKGQIQLSIGVSSTLCKYVLLSRLPDFFKQYPGIKLNICCQSTTETCTELENGKIHLGLIGLENGKRISTKLITSPLKTIDDIFVSTSSYLSRYPSIDKLFEQDYFLQNAVFILLNKENVSRKHLDLYLQKQNIRLENIMEVNHMDLAIDFAKAGLGVACVIKNFIQKELEQKELIEVHTGVKIPKRQIAFAYKENCQELAAVMDLVQYFQNQY